MNGRTKLVEFAGWLANAHWRITEIRQRASVREPVVSFVALTRETLPSRSIVKAMSIRPCGGPSSAV